MQTKIIGGGVYNPGVETVVSPNFQSLPVSLWPLDYTTGKITGLYRVTFATPAFAWVGSATMAHFRWTSPASPPSSSATSLFCVMLRINCSVTVVTAVTVQRTDPIQAFVIHNSGGGLNETDILLNNNMLRSTMAKSVILEGQGSVNRPRLTVASASGGIAGINGIQDANGFGHVNVTRLGALGSGVNSTDLYKSGEGFGHPLVLTPNNGFVINWGAQALATGTVVVTFVLEWAEVYTF